MGTYIKINKKRLKKTSTIEFGSVFLFQSWNFAYHEQNREYSTQNVAKTATIGVSEILKVSKCCHNSQKYKKSVKNDQ